MDDMNGFISATLFSTGCTINAYSRRNDQNQGVIVFITDELGKDHTEFMNNPAIRKLTKHFSSVFYDSRGTGESPYPLLGRISSLALTDDLKCVVNHARQTFPNQPIYLFTASYGTITALLFMRRFPREVDKLIIDSPILWPACPEMQYELMLNWKKNAKKTFSDEVSTAIHKHSPDTVGMIEFFMADEVTRFINGNLPYKKGSEIFSFYYAMQEFILQCDLRLIIPDLAVETLLLLGLKDKISPPKIVTECIESYNNSNICLYKFKEYDHKIHLQNSDEFARICAEFCFG